MAPDGIKSIGRAILTIDSQTESIDAAMAEAFANAQLMASAPQLLEALEDAQKALYAVCHGNGIHAKADGGYASKEIFEALERTNATLAAAKGTPC
jgi:hypothetical protein